MSVNGIFSVVFFLSLLFSPCATETELEMIRKEIHQLKEEFKNITEKQSKEMKLLKQQCGKSEDIRMVNKRVLMHSPMLNTQVSAFTASLSQHIYNLGNYQTIVFDNVFTNIGDVYSPVTALFTALHNGLQSLVCSFFCVLFPVLMHSPMLNTQVPAFTASLSQHIYNLGNYQTIVFDNVFTNIGDVYFPVTGLFTAPHNGTYFFTATIMSHTGEYLETQICINGKTLVLMYSKDSSHEQGTNSVVLALQEGDRVWVRHQMTMGSNVYGNHWSTFSGFQIS